MRAKALSRWLAVTLCLWVSAVTASPVFINEIHYDNAGADRGEAVEIAAPAGTDLSGWMLYLYNGGNGDPYGRLALGGLVPDQSDGYGVLSFTTSLQNGAADGLALVDAGGALIQFLSYEGLLTGVSGPAAGLSSEDIGVAESASQAVGGSLQLLGTGNGYEDFTWVVSAAASFGSINAGQVFSPSTCHGGRGGCAGAREFVADAGGCRSLDVGATPSAPG